MVWRAQGQPATLEGAKKEFFAVLQARRTPDQWEAVLKDAERQMIEKDNMLGLSAVRMLLKERPWENPTPTPSDGANNS